MTEERPIFTLEQAVSLCRQVEAIVAPKGWHCALGGSTLYKGLSRKDVDIILHWHNQDKPNRPTCYDLLKHLAEVLGGNVPVDVTGSYEPIDGRRVWSFYIGKMRIEFFYFGPSDPLAS